MDDYPKELIDGVTPLVFAVDAVFVGEESTNQKSTAFETFYNYISSKKPKVQTQQTTFAPSDPLSDILSSDPALAVAAAARKLPSFTHSRRNNNHNSKSSDFFSHARVVPVSSRHAFPPSKDPHGNQNTIAKLNHSLYAARKHKVMPSPSQNNPYSGNGSNNASSPLVAILAKNPIQGILPEGWFWKTYACATIHNSNWHLYPSRRRHPIKCYWNNISQPPLTILLRPTSAKKGKVQSISYASSNYLGLLLQEKKSLSNWNELGVLEQCVDWDRGLSRPCITLVRRMVGPERWIRFSSRIIFKTFKMQLRERACCSIWRKCGGVNGNMHRCTMERLLICCHMLQDIVSRLHYFMNFRRLWIRKGVRRVLGIGVRRIEMWGNIINTCRGYVLSNSAVADETYSIWTRLRQKPRYHDRLTTAKLQQLIV